MDVASERNKFEIATVWTSVHGAAKRRIAAVDRFLNVFQFAFTGMKSIFDFTKMIMKIFCNTFMGLLYTKWREKKTPSPLKIEGLGELMCRRHFCMYIKSKTLRTDHFKLLSIHKVLPWDESIKREQRH